MYIFEDYDVIKKLDGGVSGIKFGCEYLSKNHPNYGIRVSHFDSVEI